MIAVTKRRIFWRITFKDILTLLCAVAVPIALGIYTAVTYNQEQEKVRQDQDFSLQRAVELRQRDNGYLYESKDPWPFANAYYRAVHRQWDPLRKGDVLQFLKEKQLIGRSNCTAECPSKKQADIIRLNELDFNFVKLISQTDRLNQLNLDCVVFNQVSLIDATFSFANLNGASFDHARLINVKFDGVSLKCASFNGTNLRGADFRNSNLTGAQFLNADLSAAKLTQDQQKQASFFNTIMPDGTLSPTRTTIRTKATTRATTTTKTTAATTTIITTTTTAAVTTTVTTTAAATTVGATTIWNTTICSNGGIGLTFDDLTDDTQLYNYSNIVWENAYVYTRKAMDNGFYTAVRSGENAIFNKNGTMITMKSTDKRLLTLHSLAAAADLRDSLRLTVTGYNSTGLIIHDTFILQVFNVSYLTFNNYSELARITFSTSGGTQNPTVYADGTQFAMDNICLTFK